jgi:nitrogen regulatory protein PII
MATQRQRKLAEAIVANAKTAKPVGVGQLLVGVGYSESVATAYPTKIIESEGVQEALEDFGFSPLNARKVVGRILNGGKEENQIRAADMIFKVHGSYAPDKSVTVHVGATVDQEAVRAMAKVLAEQGRLAESE